MPITMYTMSFAVPYRQHGFIVQYFNWRSGLYLLICDIDDCVSEQIYVINEIDADDFDVLLLMSLLTIDDCIFEEISTSTTSSPATTSSRALEARPSGEIAINVYDRLIADNGLCRSELLLKILKCNVEQAPRLTGGWTRCLGGGGACVDAEEGVFLGNDLTTPTFWLWSFKLK